MRDSGAEGIGLYRSEFLIDAARPEAASEQAQLETYRSLLEAMRPLPVTVRTFDAGEDRWGSLSSRGAGHRERFGLRGVRAALQHDERFRLQIQALLRAAPAGALRILLPFVTTGDELRQTRILIGQIAHEMGVGMQVPIGAMIEVPAAALTVDHLAAYADFLSVGTNDLIQYTLAIDRTDERLAGHYEPRTPAVLRLLRAISITGRRAKLRSVGVRRDGRRSPARGIARRARLPDVQHDAGGDPDRQARPRRARRASGRGRRAPRAPRPIGRRGRRRAGADGRRHASSRRGADPRHVNRESKGRGNE